MIHVLHQVPGTKCVPSLQLTQEFGLPTVLAQALVRNWSSLFLNSEQKIGVKSQYLTSSLAPDKPILPSRQVPRNPKHKRGLND